MIQGTTPTGPLMTNEFNPTKKVLDTGLLLNHNTRTTYNYPLQVHSHLENPKHLSQKMPLLNPPYSLQPHQDQTN